MNIFQRLLLACSMILALNLGLSNLLFSQESPQYINYQAVARNGAGEELGGIFLDVEFSIYEGTPSGLPVYVESHTDVPTDPFGLFSLKIGNGVVLQGNFSSINWSAGTYLNVSIDEGSGMSDLGTYELVSVPYSFYSSKADSASYGADEDADPENEIQELILVANLLSLSGDNSGTQIDLSSYNTDDQELSIDIADPENITINLENSSSVSFSVADADADSTNELQTISKVGNEVVLSDNGGSFFDEVDDADADPANELQSISKSGNTVTLSNDGGSFTDEVDDADADPANEIQTISKAGTTVTLSNGGGFFTDAVNDADADPSNELISNMEFNSASNVLTVTESGADQSVDLSELKADKNWEVNGQNVTNSNSGNVGINESNPSSTFQIMGSTAAKVRVEGPSGTNYL